MKATQTTATANRYAVARPDLIHTHADPTPKAKAKADTTERLNALMEKRNTLCEALANFPTLSELTEGKEEVIHTLAETIAQISVYKTLDRLSDSPKDITTNGAIMCEKLRKAFVFDMITYHHNDTTATYSDAFDLFNLAYVTAWQYLNTPHPLTLDDIVLTEVKKNGNEKNYTIFQSACKSIREYIHTWSKSDQYKKLHYVVGIADNGEAVTSSKRPADDLADIDPEVITAFFTRHDLTAREQEILRLYMDGERAENIAEALCLNLRMVQRDIKSAKAKFPTASAYAELKTAENAERLAKAKAEKNPTDSTYQRIHTEAQKRTANAYKIWLEAFRKENRQNTPTV